MAWHELWYFSKTDFNLTNLCGKRTLLIFHICLCMLYKCTVSQRNRKSRDTETHSRRREKYEFKSIAASKQSQMDFIRLFCHIGFMQHTPLCLQQKFIVISSLNRLNAICQFTYIHFIL